MPELPEVEVVRQGLKPLVAGKRITGLACSTRALRYPLPGNLNAKLGGRTCLDVHRRAKYLLFLFDADIILAWHMGMTGVFRILPDNAPSAGHEHIRMYLSDGSSLCYADPRRFGYIGLMPAGLWQAHPWFRQLGPEPLEKGFDQDYMIARCKGKNAAIKNTLLQAQVVAGIGNIYACEVLFRARIHPARPAGRIGPGRIQTLVGAIRQVLNEAIAAGGSSISDFSGVDGKPGYFTRNLHVYGRAGQSCHRCKRTIRRILLAGRSTYYCPGCQH